MKTLFVFFMLMTPAGSPIGEAYFRSFQVTPETCAQDSHVSAGPVNIRNLWYIEVIWCE